MTKTKHRPDLGPAMRGALRGISIKTLIAAALVLAIGAVPTLAAGVTITPVKGQQWSGVVGTGHEPCPIDPDIITPNTHNCTLLGPDSNITASITWGDGTAVDHTATASRSCASDTATSCAIMISGSHTYAGAGTFAGSFSWSDPDPDYPGSGNGTFTANVASTAPPVLQTIDFDDLAPGTAVGTGYHAQGVTFGLEPGGLHGGNVIVTDADGAAASGSSPNAAQVAGASDPVVWASFTAPQAKVYVKAGDPAAAAGATVTLTGYNSSGQPVGSDQATISSGGNAATPLSLQLASATISYIRLSEAQPTGKLLIDDFAFYVPGDGAYSVQPYNDISVTTSGTDATGQSYDGTYDGVVARIYKSDSTADNAANYTATIRWGDGSTSTGSIAAPTKPGAAFDVKGLHYYQPVDTDTWKAVIVHVVKTTTGLAQTTRESALVKPPPPPPGGPTAQFAIVEPPNPGARPTESPLHFDASKSTGGTCQVASGCAPPSYPVSSYKWTVHLPGTLAYPDPTKSVTCPSGTPTLTAVFNRSHDWRVDLTVTNPAGQTDSTSQTYYVEPNQNPTNQLHYSNVVLVCGTHYGDLPDITNVSPGYVSTPQALQQGTLVTISGQGFSSNAHVQFGNPASDRQADYVSGDGKTIQTHVPPDATSGRVTVVIPESGDNSLGIASERQLFVDTYRDVNGYQFRNQGPDDITFDQLTRAFGTDQTYDSANPCWPWADCSLQWRDPLAMAFDALANHLMDGKGICYGMSLTSKLFTTGALSLGDYPHTGGNDVFHLNGPAGPSGPLTELLNAAQVQQLSYEFFASYAERTAGQLIQGGAATSRDIRAEVEAALRAGEYPMISLRNGGKGHVVVAYNITDDSDHPGGYYIWVYDSNLPYGSKDNGAPGEPSNVFVSRIQIDSDGNWSLPSTNWTGGSSTLLVWRLSDLPSHPKMAKAIVAATPFIIVFGSGAGEETTQLSDAAGHTLYDGSGQLNADPKTRLDATPFAPLTGGSGGSRPDVFLLPHGANGLKQTIVGTGSGSETYTVVAGGVMSQVSTQVGKGVPSELDLVPDTGGLSFSTQAPHAPLTLSLLAASGKARHGVQVTTTGSSGGDTLVFSHGQQGFRFVHRGTPTEVSLTLTDTEPGKAPATFQSPPVQVGSGQAVRVDGVRWSALGGRTIPVNVGGRNRQLANRAGATKLATLGAVRLVVRHRTVTMTTHVHVRGVRSASQLVLAWIARRGGRVVKTHAAVLKGRTVAWRFLAPSAGRYSVSLSLVLTAAHGAALQVARVTRTVSFRIR